MRKKKAEKFYRFNVVVEGGGDFPIDMLRYDHCVPATENDSYILKRDEYRRVKLVMFCASGNGPTLGRWKSFTWNVVSCNLYGEVE
jgi:hypothetical protein